MFSKKAMLRLKTDNMLESWGLLAILMLISLYIVTKLIIYENWDAVIMASCMKHCPLTCRVILHLPKVLTTIILVVWVITC